MKGVPKHRLMQSPCGGRGSCGRDVKIGTKGEGMGILVCQTPKGVTGRRGTGGMAAVGGTWAGRSLRGTSRDSSSELRSGDKGLRRQNPDDSRGGVAGWRDSSLSAPDE